MARMPKVGTRRIINTTGRSSVKHREARTATRKRAPTTKTLYTTVRIIDLGKKDDGRLDEAASTEALEQRKIETNMVESWLLIGIPPRRAREAGNTSDVVDIAVEATELGEGDPGDIGNQAW
jgi:hypothetical protein